MALKGTFTPLTLRPPGRTSGRTPCRPSPSVAAATRRGTYSSTARIVEDIRLVAHPGAQALARAAFSDRASAAVRIGAGRIEGDVEEAAYGELVRALSR